jgi:hypothetical protein
MSVMEMEKVTITKIQNEKNDKEMENAISESLRGREDD